MPSKMSSDERAEIHAPRLSERMRIYLPRVETSPWSDVSVDDLEDLAKVDQFGVHELVEDLDHAEIVLFPQCHMVDWKLEAIRRHPAARRHWPKVMVVDERDRPWSSFPGVYVSQPRSRFASQEQRAWGYLRREDPQTRKSRTVEPDLLFSFIGSPTASCRRPLFELRHPDGIVEEIRDFMFWNPDSDDYQGKQRRYQEVLARSRFVLCPRGHGTSSIRLYETMAAGRVPVIISDEWVAPPGLDWDRFSLRVAESEAGLILELL